MFNHHSTEQNVGWERDVARLIVVYKTLRDIEEGEELCISYGGRLWFKDTDAQQETSESDDGSELLNSIQID